METIKEEKESGIWFSRFIGIIIGFIYLLIIVLVVLNLTVWKNL